LPREAELVFEPAARSLFAVLCQLAPEVVDLLLRVAVNLERHRLVELEMRAAVQRQEFLPFDFELHGHDRSGLLAVNLESLFSIAADFSDRGILEHGSVKFRRLFGLRIEPEAGRDLSRRHLHDLLLSRSGGWSALATKSARSCRARPCLRVTGLRCAGFVLVVALHPIHD